MQRLFDNIPEVRIILVPDDGAGDDVVGSGLPTILRGPARHRSAPSLVDLPIRVLDSAILLLLNFQVFFRSHRLGHCDFRREREPDSVRDVKSVDAGEPFRFHRLDFDDDLLRAEDPLLRSMKDAGEVGICLHRASNSSARSHTDFRSPLSQ